MYRGWKNKGAVLLAGYSLPRANGSWWMIVSNSPRRGLTSSGPSGD